MTQDNILSPEIKLIRSDVFYLFYEMMMQSLKTDNVKDGLNKSLFLLRRHLSSGNIALFRKNNDGSYVYKMSDSGMTELIQPVSCIINKTSTLTKQKEVFDLELNLSTRLKNMILIHINIDDKDDCILSILNTKQDKELEPQFWNRLKDTMSIILKRTASYERNVRAITTDMLTGLDNRNSYEMRTNSIDENDANLVVGVFDLFQLKQINDNYTHTKGDEYIKKAADILRKYWPKEKVKQDENGIESFQETGHCVYRVGGDEFVLLTTVENYQLASIKSSLATDESHLIDIGIDDTIPLGINCGIVKHNPGDYFKQTFMRTDEIMQKDKTLMYQKYNVERRR